MSAIVTTDQRVTLLGDGDSTAADLHTVLALAPILVAADGAARRALAAGVVPDAVIGDLDSLDPESRARIPAERIHHLPDQETTDFDKCLRAIRAPLVLAVGFTGERLDHQLAALNALARHPEARCILIGDADICFAAPPLLTMDLPPETRLSLFPLNRVGARGTGVRWPLEGPEFHPFGRIGTSNLATGPVALQFDAPGMLVILPRDRLDHAIAALAPGDGARQGALPPLR